MPQRVGNNEFCWKSWVPIVTLRMLGVGFRDRNLGKQRNRDVQSKGGKGAGHKVKEKV